MFQETLESKSFQLSVTKSLKQSTKSIVKRY